MKLAKFVFSKTKLLVQRKEVSIFLLFGLVVLGLYFANSRWSIVSAHDLCYECRWNNYDYACGTDGYEHQGSKCPESGYTNPRYILSGTHGTVRHEAPQACQDTFNCNRNCYPNDCYCGGGEVNINRCPAVSCTVTWSTVPSTIKPNTNFTATITQGQSNNWNNPMTYKDGVAVPGGTAVSGGYTWVINSGSAASHELKFAVNSSDAGGSGQTVYCTPNQYFKTIAPPTASITGPTEVKVGEAVGPYVATANGTNLSFVRMHYALKSIIDAGTTSPNPWTRIGDATQNDFCGGSSSCTASASTTTSSTFSSPGLYYVAVNANQTDGAGNAMPCTGNPQRPLPSGWVDCGPSDLLTVNASDVTVTLDIRAAASTDTRRAPRTSGRLSSEVGGEGYVNPMIITLTINSASGTTTIDDYYAILYSTASGAQLTTKSNFLSNLQSRINSDPKNGILLHYNNSTSRFRVWEGNSWQNIPSGLSGREIKQGNTTLYNAIQGEAGPTSASWQIRIAEGFGSKTLYTPIYAVAGSLSTFDPDFLVPAHYNESTGAYSATLFFSP